MIQKKYYKLVKVSYADSDVFRITNISEQAGNFSVTKVGSPTAPDMEYSTDGVTWTAYDFTNLPTISVPAGVNLYLRGNNSSGFNIRNSRYYKFSMDVNHNIGGNICSLIDKTNPETVTSLPNACFYYLFQNDTHLVSAGNMNFGNVTSVGDNGCNAMFSGCNSMTTVPDLSGVTTIGNYGCNQMFYNCTSLTTAPDLSNVTTIGDHGCENMLTSCYILTTAPDMSSVTNIGIDGCDQMFNNCIRLSSVTTPNIDTWDTSKFSNWLYGAGTQATGTKTVYKPAALSIPADSSDGVPTGWTTANY